MNVNSFQDRENVTPCQAMVKHWPSLRPSIGPSTVPSIKSSIGQVLDQVLCQFLDQLLDKYSYNRMKRHGSLFMKQNCHFDRGLAQYKHATPPLRFSGINTTLLGFPKRCITLVYLKGLKSYQPSKLKRVDFLPLYLVKRTFHL